MTDFNSVLNDIAAKRAELQRQLDELDKGATITSAMIKTLEDGLSQLQGEARNTCITSLLRVLQQEAKLSGLQVAVETTQSNGNGSKPVEAGKKRRATQELVKPNEFAIFPQNNRLGVEGAISELKVRYKRVFIGIDGVRTTEVCPGSAKAWREYIGKNMSIESIVAGDKWGDCSLEGNYVLEITGLSFKDLSKLLSLDFSQAPDGEVNELQMERDTINLLLMDESSEQSERSVIQEEIMEGEPEPVKIVEPENGYYAVGTKFQLTGVTGYEGAYGEVVGITPGSAKPYEASVDGFQFNPMLSHDQIVPIEEVVESEPEIEEDDEELDEANLPF
jgi:hypothetical protein